MEANTGPLVDIHKRFVKILNAVPAEHFVSSGPCGTGRPPASRQNLARAFLAKAALNLQTTRGLIERLECDGVLWHLCGWSGHSRLPSESTFSRAFAGSAASGLPERMHGTLVRKGLGGRLVLHISRDSTAIKARGKTAPKQRAPEKPKRKRGRPPKGEEVVKEPKRIGQQRRLGLGEMLKDLPRGCDTGTKRNSKGHRQSWRAASCMPTRPTETFRSAAFWHRPRCTTARRRFRWPRPARGGWTTSMS